MFIYPSLRAKVKPLLFLTEKSHLIPYRYNCTWRKGQEKGEDWMESLWCLCDHETDTESIPHDNVLFYINYLHKFQILYTSFSTCCQCWSWKAVHGSNLHFLFLLMVVTSSCLDTSVLTWAIEHEIQTARLYLSISLSSHYINTKHIYI